MSEPNKNRKTRGPLSKATRTCINSLVLVLLSLPVAGAYADELQVFPSRVSFRSVPLVTGDPGEQPLTPPAITINGFPISRLLRRSIPDINGDNVVDTQLSGDFGRLGLSSRYRCSKFVVLSRSTGPMDVTEYNLDQLVSFAPVIEPLPDRGCPTSTIEFPGDVNGDGVPDLFLTYRNESGLTSVVKFGPFAAGDELSTSISNQREGVSLGKFTLVGSVGDVNGDGFDDFVIQIPFQSSVFSRWLVSGKELSSSVVPFDVARHPSIIGAFIDNSEQFQKFEMTGVGDVNGDTYDDLVVRTNDNGLGFIAGHAGLSLNTTNLSDATTPILPFSCPSVTCTVNAVGDFDADGYADIGISGVPIADNNYQTDAYLLYGSLDGPTTASSTDLQQVNENTYFPYGSFEGLFGDLNDDGASDVFMDSIGIVFGTPGRRLPVVQIDRNRYQFQYSDNGIRLTFNSGSTRQHLIADADGDGIDDYIDYDRYLPGRRNANGIVLGAPAVLRAPTTADLILFINGDDATENIGSVITRLDNGPEQSQVPDGNRITIVNLEPERSYQLQIELLSTSGTSLGKRLVRISNFDLRFCNRISPTIEGEVYSSTTLELFVERLDPWNCPFIEYLIWRDFEFLGSTEGTSFLVTDADSSRTENYFFSRRQEMSEYLDDPSELLRLPITIFRTPPFVTEAMSTNPQVPPASPSGSVAGVKVQGNTISWPSDGWYQVQSADGAQTFCEAGTFCVVGAGTYLVINHSSGMRYDNIRVPSTTETPESLDQVAAETGLCGEKTLDGTSNSVCVEGSEILWSDDGWYQVQSAENFRTLCEGTRSCQVGPGNYIVINHTTGMRFENIRVPQRL